MSSFVETRVLGPATSVEVPPMSPSAPAPDESRSALVRMWRKRVEDRKGKADFKEWERFKAEAKKCGKGDVLDDADIASWRSNADTAGAPVVQVNLWRRIRAHYINAVYSHNPNLAFRPREGRSNDLLLKQAASVAAMSKYVWEECRQQAEARRALTDGFNCNVSTVKTDYDPARELYRARWVPGLFIVDAECHGDLSRAMWVAEEITLPAGRILQDETFDKDVRLRLYEKWKGGLEKVEMGGFEQPKTVHYICSREGIDPLAGIRAMAGAEQTEAPRKVAFAIVEGFDEFLYEAPDPYPYLDEDEFPYPTLQIEEEPGEWYGVPPWKMMKGLIEAINWLVTFHVCAMKKKAGSVILTNKALWKKGAELLPKAAFMECFEVEGDPNAAAMKLDLGSGDMGQLQSAEMLMEWLARITGFNEIAAGESSGRKTATEADHLQKNTSLVTKGADISFNVFLNEMVRQVVLALLYYVPQYSRTVGPDGMVMTQQVVEMPAMGPPDPMTGMPPPPQPMAVPAPAPPDDAKALGAVTFPDDPIQALRMPDTIETPGAPMIDEMSGQIVPGTPTYRHETPGKVLRRGVDFFCGPDVAMYWPTQPLEDVKRDLLLSIEAGSTRANYRHDQQQAAMNGLQMVGPILQQVGGWDALYEWVSSYVQTLPLNDTGHLMPPREVFVNGMKAAVMTAQAAQQQGGAEQGGPPQEAKAA